MTWDAELSATEYHVYGGLVSDMSTFFSGNCWDDRDADRGDTTLTDTALPLPGESLFCLITAEDVDGNEGSLGELFLGTRLNSSACP